MEGRGRERLLRAVDWAVMGAERRDEVITRAGGKLFARALEMMREDAGEPCPVRARRMAPLPLARAAGVVRGETRH